MKIAYKHLLNFFIEKPSIDEISNKLFQLGHEHEIENSIFDMEFTPNRGDCLSLLGLIRDLNVFYRSNIDIPLYKNELPLLNLNFINKVPDKCPEISFLNIEIKGEISKYKDYLENYFKDLKLNKNNFFTDISNYIAYEMGQPTHSYDFDCIGNDITLNINKDKSEFTTLLGNSINLKDSDLVFTSENNIINLSGVIGGLSTACNKMTKNALIECAYFKPDSILGKAVKYNLHSDASHKFERGTDPKCHEKVLRRFIQIVKDHAQIIKIELHTDTHSLLKEIELDFNLEKVNQILGMNVTEEVYNTSLTKLGFEVNGKIKVPSYRSDISHQNDLAEELARVIGYDNIPIKSINLKGLPNDLIFSKEEKVKSFLTHHGFSEVINSSFSSSCEPTSVKVDNPLDSNRKYIRNNLTDSLIENVIYNEKRQKDSIKLFEISDIYTSSKKGNKKEKMLAIIISGRKSQNYLDFSQKIDKKYLSALFKALNIEIDKDIFTIDRSKLKSKIQTPIFAIEVKIDDLNGDFSNYVPHKRSLDNCIKYQPISEFPSSYRDFSFSIEDSSKIDNVIKMLDLSSANFLKYSFMFDFYINAETKITKIGYRFIFQAPNKTLTDSEIDESVNIILAPILSLDSVNIPGVF